MAAQKQTVLITGCSPGGIGNSLAREFHAKGYHVLATARDPSQITDLASIGCTTLALTVDQADSVAKLKEEVARITGGRLDYLVNNAGRNYTVPALHLDIEEVEYTFRTNVFGVMRMCQAFAPLLIETKGTIVQIGSVAGIIPYVFGSAYNATKAALHAYSNTLRVELSPFDVKVITIVTGGVKSNIARADRTLPEGSVYVAIEPEYIRRTKHSQEVGMPNQPYARKVVAAVTGRNKPRQVWAGAQARLIWWLTTFLPLSVFDGFFWRTFNLWKVAQAHVKRKTA